MICRREANDRSHNSHPAVCCSTESGTSLGRPTQKLHSRDTFSILRRNVPHQEHCARQSTHAALGGNARRRAPGPRSQSTVFVAYRGRSWVQYRGLRGLRRAKATDTKVGRPTDLSATRWRTSARSSFGLKTQRLISRLHQIAACAKPNASSAAIANGQATQPLRLSPKSLLERKCATSA
jgi:hypothetical protein